jgi:hypothetical protein
MGIVEDIDTSTKYGHGISEPFSQEALTTTEKGKVAL